jgi:hypothetical protein
MDAKQRRLKLMRFWLFGSVLIVWAAVTAYIGLFTGNPMGAVVASLPMTSIVAVAAVILYFVYRVWVNRQPG